MRSRFGNQGLEQGRDQRGLPLGGKPRESHLDVDHRKVGHERGGGRILKPEKNKPENLKTRPPSNYEAGTQNNNYYNNNYYLILNQQRFNGQLDVVIALNSLVYMNQ